MRHLSFTLFFATAMVFARPAMAADILGVAWDGLVVSVDSSSGSESAIGPSGFNGLNSLARNKAGQFITVAGHPLFDTDSTLLRLDPTTGVGTSLGTITGISAGRVRALAFSSDDVLFAIINGGGPTAIGVADDLYTINLSTGVPSLVGNTGFSGIQALTFGSDGTLYGWDVGAGVGLVTLNPANGSGADVNSLVGEANIDVQSLAFSPEGTLYGVRNSLYLIDPGTGVPIKVGTGGLSDLRGIEFLGKQDPGLPSSEFPVLPEPATGLLLIVGLAGFVGYQQYRARNNSG